MRHTDARATCEFLDLILGSAGALELEDDLDAASDEACDYGAGHAIDQEGGEALVGDVPHIDVEGVGLVEQQHDDVDRDLDNEHQEDVAPRPHEAERRRPTHVEAGKLQTECLDKALDGLTDGGRHVRNNKVDAHDSDAEGQTCAKSLRGLEAYDQTDDHNDQRHEDGRSQIQDGLEE